MFCKICSLEPLNNQHLLNCFVLNNGEHPQLTYEQILNGNIDEKTLVLKKMQDNIQKRDKFLNNRLIAAAII